MQNFMKTKLFWIVVSLLFSCTSGWQKSKTGLEYEFIEDVDGKQAKPGDILTLAMCYTSDADSMLFDSKMVSDSFRLILKKPKFKASLEEGLALMSVGDSIQFMVNADSLYAITFQNSKPEFIKPGSQIKFYARLKKISPIEEYEKELEMARRKNYEAEQKKIDAYIKENNITTAPLEDGVYVIETKKGKGRQVLYDMKVGVRYTGKFFDGKVFDTNANEKELYYFTVGREEVIFGWDEALQHMNLGGKATVIIPSKYAYGQRGSGPIPPYTPLVFDIEVVEMKP